MILLRRTTLINTDASALLCQTNFVLLTVTWHGLRGIWLCVLPNRWCVSSWKHHHEAIWYLNRWLHHSLDSHLVFVFNFETLQTIIPNKTSCFSKDFRGNSVKMKTRGDKSRMHVQTLFLYHWFISYHLKSGLLKASFDIHRCIISKQHRSSLI